MTAEHNQYSTGDYCESHDSSLKPFLEVPSKKKHFHIPRCSRNHCKRLCHQPKITCSFPRRSQRNGRRRKHNLDETTSIDDRKSFASYSSVLTVDVSREMEAVNRDIAKIIRKCDEYCVDGDNISYKECCHRRPIQHRKSTKTLRGLTQEQVRILSMKRPPIEKLKDVPLSMLKPRPPKHSSEKVSATSHSKFKNSREIRHIVDETDDLLRDIYKELTRGKHFEDRKDEDISCHCEGTRFIKDPKPLTCLERYLGQNKCRRFLENRWVQPPKWRDLFEKGDYYIKRSGGKSVHVHDTNCISEPVTAAYLVKTPKSSKPKLINTGVNTDSNEVFETQWMNKNLKVSADTNTDVISKETYHTVDSTLSEKPINLDIKKIVRSFPSCKSSNKSIFKNQESKIRSVIDSYELKSTPNNTSVMEDNDKFTDSLLLDRHLGLSLDKMPSVVINECKSDPLESPVRSSTSTTRPVIPLPQTDSFCYLNDKGSNKTRGGGDSVSTIDCSKYPVTQIINKIVNKTGDWAANNLKAVDVTEHDKYDYENRDVDTSICLEIMRRLVDLLSRNHKKIIDNFVDVPAQYSRIRKMKQDHLSNIEKEIQSIQDLEFYLKNATPARSNNT